MSSASVHSRHRAASRRDNRVSVLPFLMLILDELAGGMLEDLAELLLSTPSTDFVSESQMFGSVEPGRIKALMKKRHLYIL